MLPYSEKPFKTYDVITTVKSVYGLEETERKVLAAKGIQPCEYYRPGDKIIFYKDKIEGAVCYSALASMIYKIVALNAGVDFPWVSKNGTYLHICPDVARPVVFEIRRVDARAHHS